MMVTAKSYAKINLGLQIVGVKDRFHLLNSVFVGINLFDTISIEENDVDIIEGMEIPLADNLIYKTLCLIRKKYTINKCLKIKIEKNIPLASGLGGGSSNSLCLIKLVDKLWNLNLHETDIKNLCSLIGSDVSFFMNPYPSYLNDRGTNFKKINLNRISGILIFNEAYFSTKEVFNMYDFKKIKYSENEEEFTNLRLYNDLEKACCFFPQYQKVKKAKEDLLKRGALYSLMSGSGGSVFGIYEDEEILNENYENLKKDYKFCFKFTSLE